MHRLHAAASPWGRNSSQVLRLVKNRISRPFPQSPFPSEKSFVFVNSDPKILDAGSLTSRVVTEVILAFCHGRNFAKLVILAMTCTVSCRQSTSFCARRASRG